MYQILLVFLGLPLITLAGSGYEKDLEDKYYEVKAERGDGIYSLLRKYELDGHSCNFKRFYDLNPLKKDAPL